MNTQELLTKFAAPVTNQAMEDLFNAYINPAVAILSALAGLIIVISIIVGGIQYSSAGGDPSKVAAAKQRITNAVIALLVLIFLVAGLNWLIPGGLTP